MTVSAPQMTSLSCHVLLLLFLGTAVNACSGDSTGVRGEDRLSPPTLALTGSHRVLIEATGDTVLEVAAHLYNPTSVHIRVGTGSACPPAVSLLPDPSAEYMVNIDVEDCPSTAPTIDMAPGDSLTLLRVLPASALSTYAHGVYGINVGVASSTGLLGAWAGAVSLPLTPGS